MTVKTAIREWLSQSSYTVKDLGKAIEVLETDIACAKSLLVKARGMRSQLIIKEDLKLDRMGEKLSVRCDGNIITMGFIKGSADGLEKGILKRLGFSWSKDKLEYTRKVAGADIGAIMGLIEEVESD